MFFFFLPNTQTFSIFTSGENISNTTQDEQNSLKHLKEYTKHHGLYLRFNLLWRPKLGWIRFLQTWCLCSKFTEGARCEHSASIRSQSIIDVHVNILWRRAMEKMTLYSGTHTYTWTHTCTHKEPQEQTAEPQRGDIPHCHAWKKSVIGCIYLIFMHHLNGSFVWMLSCFCSCLCACSTKTELHEKKRPEFTSECDFAVKIHK